MSGICGWINNQLGLETGSLVLEQMISEHKANPGHSVKQTCLQYYAVATIGHLLTIDICQQDGLSVAVQGSLQWTDVKLSETAMQRGQAHAVLEVYRKDGINCLRNLYGPFALSIIDEEHKKTIIAIDKLGIGSMFYSVRNGQLIFASNARAIQHHTDFTREINPQSIFDYLFFHMVPGPRCIFKDVEKLLPAQYLLIENQKVTKEFYWQPTYKEFSKYNIEKLEDDFLGLLKSSMIRAAEGGKIGTFLSGGTDSSTIAGMLRNLTGTPIDTYSIGFDAEGFDEMEYARIAARHFNTRLHEYYLTPQDVVDAIPLIAKAYDEPFGNASAVPAYYCAKLAKADGIDTLLAGDGGDELFGGNERYAKQKVFEFYQEIPEFLRSNFIEPAIFKLPMTEKVPALAKARSYILQAKVPLPDRLESYNFMTRMPLEDMFEADFLAMINVRQPMDYLQETYSRASAKSSLNRMLFLDLKFTLADSDLRKVNRMCETAGVDVRYPLLDEELLRFSTELPKSLKLRGLKLRYFFKHALKDFLPNETLKKSKHGFGLPFGMWMNKHAALHELSRELLESIGRRGIVKQTYLQNLQLLHREHPSYYGVMIWVLIMLEQWLQT